MYVFEMLKVIGTDPWRFPSTKINIYYTYNLLYIDLSDFIKTWPLGFRPVSYTHLTLPTSDLV